MCRDRPSTLRQHVTYSRTGSMAHVPVWVPFPTQAFPDPQALGTSVSLTRCPSPVRPSKKALWEGGREGLCPWKYTSPSPRGCLFVQQSLRSSFMNVSRK